MGDESTVGSKVGEFDGETCVDPGVRGGGVTLVLLIEIDTRKSFKNSLEAASLEPLSSVANLDMDLCAETAIFSSFFERKGTFFGDGLTGEASADSATAVDTRRSSRCMLAILATMEFTQSMSQTEYRSAMVNADASNEVVIASARTSARSSWLVVGGRLAHEQLDGLMCE